MPLFTQMRGETVWKIGMGPKIVVPEAAKGAAKGPDRPLFAAQEARWRGPLLFSKQFRKGYSPKFAFRILNSPGLIEGLDAVYEIVTCGSRH
jgi:hypothetical protein